MEHHFTTSDVLVNLMLFAMASFLGIELIRHVSRLLHTPLMSLTNALSSIAIVAALVVMDHRERADDPILWLATIAVACSASNAIGGFMITERILRMFKRDERKSGGH